jgi:uncharacterized membrane protein
MRWMPTLSPTGRAFAVLAALFTFIGLSRHAAWHAHTLDMAYYARLVWGLGHGDPSQPVIDAPHALGLHFEPILLPLAALSRLGLPATPLLLCVQALAGAAAIFPAHALARRHLPAHALPVALCVFLVPAFGRNLDFDFHPNTLAVWPLLAFVNALDAGRLRPAALWLGLALTCREDIGLQGAAAALLFPGLGLRARLGFAAGGLLWFGAYAGVLQPAFAHGHPRSSLAQHFGMLGVPVGAGLPALLAGLAAQPVALLQHLATFDRVLYVPVLLATTALLPLRAPRLLGGALPIVGVNLLSGFEGVRDLDSHYLTAAAPFLYAAAVVGAGALPDAPRAARHLRWVFALAFLLCVRPWPWTRVRAWFPDADTTSARAAAAQIPPDAPLVAPSEILAHLAERPRVHHRWFAPADPALWRITPEWVVVPPSAPPTARDPNTGAAAAP